MPPAGMLLSLTEPAARQLLLSENKILSAENKLCSIGKPLRLRKKIN